MLQHINKRTALRYALVNALAVLLAAPWPALAQTYTPAPYPPAPGVQSPYPAAPQAQPPYAQPGSGSTALPGDLSGVDQPWPRPVPAQGFSLVLYQPQVDAWDGNRLQLKAAFGVNVEAPSAADQHFGAAWMTARTEVDKDRGLVYLRDLQVTRVDLPTAPGLAPRVDQALEQQAGGVARVIALDQLRESLAVAQAQQGREQAIDVANEPPLILFSNGPAVLVAMDGEPVLRAVAPGLDRVLNTNVMLLRQQRDGRFFLRVAGLWATAATLQGPWTIVYGDTRALDQVKQQALQESAVDLLDDDDQPGPYGVLPEIHVTEVPAELLQIDGQPQFQPIGNTRLLYVANTVSDIFLDTAAMDYYVLVSGRWFRARTFEGPWAFVDSNDLPPDFRRIPEAHPKGGVLVSIAGTPQAREAAIANTIPQTATVDMDQAQFQPVYDGQPQFQPVEGTPLYYAPNAPVPVIRVDPTTYYAVDDGVWFTAPAPNGPWLVATYVPAVIYTIPPRAPIYYVTYVRVYGHSGRHVQVGYTPGYLGTYVTRRGTVVYGSGYRYQPWVGKAYYARPATYGYGAGFAFGTFTGFALGLATAAIVGQPSWGPYRSTQYRDRDRDGRDRRPDQRPGAAPARANVTVVNTTNIYNSWDNRAVVRTTNVEPRRAPDTLRERREQVDRVRVQSQQNRERAAQTRPAPGRPAATPAPAPAVAAPVPAPAPAVARPAPATRNDVYVGPDGRPYRRGEGGDQRLDQQRRVQDQQRNADQQRQRDEAAKAAAENQRRQRDEAARAAAENQRRQRDEAAKAASENQRRQRDEAAKAASENQRRQRDEAAKAASENQRRQRDEAARANAERQRRQPPPPPTKPQPPAPPVAQPPAPPQAQPQGAPPARRPGPQRDQGGRDQNGRERPERDGKPRVDRNG